MRQEPNAYREPRTVLSCWKCNNERGSKDAAAAGVEAQRERCGNYPVTVAKVQELAKRFGSARRALLGLYKARTPIDNGYCVWCGGFRSWSECAEGVRPEPCENPRCITHRVERQLGRGVLTWPAKALCV